MRYSGIPNGNAFLVATPQTDAAREQLYNEQLQREHYAQQQASQVDQQMGREFANVRDADMPEIMDNYNKYKQSQIQLMRNPRILNNPTEFQKASQESMLALGKVHGLINDSKQAKQMLQDANKVYYHKPDAFADDYADRINKAMDTPTSKLSQIRLADGTTADLSNPEGFMYQGYNTNFLPIEQKSTGAIGSKPNSFSSQVSKNDPLSDTVTSAYFTNSPYQYKQNFMGALMQHAAGRDAGAAWDKLTTTPDGQALLQHVNEMFNSISPQKWKEMTGTEKPQDLEPQDPNNKAEQFASFKAKAYAVNAGVHYTPHDEINRDRSRQRSQDIWLQRNKISQGEKLFLQQKNSELIAGRQGQEFQNKVTYGAATEAARDRVTNQFFNMQESSLPATEPVETDNGEVMASPVSLPPELQKALAVKVQSHVYAANKTYYDKNKKEYVGVAEFTDPTTNSEERRVTKLPLADAKQIFKNTNTKLVKPTKADVSAVTPAPHPATGHQDRLGLGL